MRLACLVLAFALILPGPPVRAEDAGKPILDTSSFWRCFYVLKMPVFRKDGAAAPLPEAFPDDWKRMRGEREAKWLTFDSPAPPEGWAQPGFDDAAWCRMSGVPATKQWVKGSEFEFRRSCYMAAEYRRGRFAVADPAHGGDLALSLTFIGGALVTVNGREVARAYLPKQGPLAADALADDYAEGEAANRALRVAIPAGALRPGVNVLGIEIRRSAHRMKDARFARDWTLGLNLGPSCGLVAVRLDAPAGAPVTANVARPAGLQAWNSDLARADFDLDYGEAFQPLRPVRITGARGGSFSGKVVVGSDKPLRGLTARVSDLTGENGSRTPDGVKGPGPIFSRIPAASVHVRYALPGVAASVQGSIDVVNFFGGTEAAADGRYLAEPDRFDALLDRPPDEIPVRQKPVVKMSLRSPGIEPSFGAVVPVWLTVDVPADAPAGDYAGTLTISVEGAAPVVAPVALHVADWPLPTPRDWRTFVELFESPESVALWYGVPLWSDEHFRLLDRSFEWMGRAGAETVYVPLICETNMGNAESMVRWTRDADGTYSQDYRAMDRYLDLAVKHLGAPDVVCFYVWDNFLPSVGRENWGTDAAKAYRGGPEVTLADAAGKLELPHYADPRAKELWKPVLEEIRRRMKARGLEDRMMLGTASDRNPDPATVAAFKDMLPGIPWVSCSHNFSRDLHGVPFGYQANAYDTSDVLDPSVSRGHGWRRPNLVQGAHFPRLTQDIYPLTTFRFMGEMAIARDYRGFARQGADFWPVLKDRRGRRVGSIAARYPKSSWWNLNLITSLLAPGPDGAVATVRYEAMREGLQECEARIYLERALLDKDRRAKIGDALAKRCQDVLDERTRAMLRAVSPLIQDGRSRANRPNDWWQSPGVIGSQWFQCSDPAARTAALYQAAADVARALGESSSRPAAGPGD